MAVGDDAVGAGMASINSTTLPANQLGTEVMRTRDYIAQRTSTTQPVAKGGTGATTAAGARANLAAAAAVHGHTTNDIVLADNVTVLQGFLASEQGRLNAVQADAASRYLPGSGDMHTGGGRVNSIGSRNFTVSLNWVAAALDGNNWLGIQPSAERFKQDIERAAYTLDDALRLAECIVTYRLRARVDGVRVPVGSRPSPLAPEWEVEPDPDAPGEVGVVAEWLIKAGFAEFVVFNDAGETLSVHYERLWLVVAGGLAELASMTRLIAAEVTDIRDRLAKLEGTTTDA